MIRRLNFGKVNDLRQARRQRLLDFARPETNDQNKPLSQHTFEEERMRRRGSVMALLVAGLACAAGLAAAQNYPSRPVMIVVPFAAGGGNDIMARLLAQHMSRAFGQQFVIDNRAGAAGTLGARAVAKSAPDGHTLMVGHSGVFGVAPSLYVNAGYDPRKDFAPIGLIASFQQILVVHPSLPVRNVKDLLALARKDPGKITYATAGIGSGSHISTELFASMADVKLTHIPYRGSGPAQGDLIAGHVPMAITTVPPAIAQIRGGLLRAIAVTGDTRLPIMPDVPTVAESGVPGYVAVIHYGMVAPAGTPRPIVDRIQREVAAMYKDPAVFKKLEGSGITAVSSTPEEFEAFFRKEAVRWDRAFKESGIKLD
jgi:tripartite-type tricarboxylate transporter receptor subunit TctC